MMCWHEDVYIPPIVVEEEWNAIRLVPLLLQSACDVLVFRFDLVCRFDLLALAVVHVSLAYSVLCWHDVLA